MKKKKKTFRESSIIRRNYYLSVFFPVATVYVFVVRHSGEDRTDLRQMPPFCLSTPTLEENDGKGGGLTLFCKTSHYNDHEDNVIEYRSRV